MIREEKLQSTSGKVEECKGDTKKLYSLVRYLTGTKVQNPMPDNTGDEKNWQMILQTILSRKLRKFGMT